MKIICPKQSLLAGVQTVSRAVPSKTTMPTLECILIDATKGIITLTANDMELAIETIVEGEIAERGMIAIDAKFLLDIVRKLPDSDITISSDLSCRTSIVCEKSRFHIIGKPGEDFNRLPEYDRNDSIVIGQFTLKDIVRQTIFSIADNDNNKMMTGELLQIEGQILKMVSLDGHRISVRKVILKDYYESHKVVVPGKTLNEVSKILNGDADSSVIIYFSDKHIAFEFGDTIVVSRLIEGEYFRIDQMFQNDYETRLNINRREFLDCIDRATLLVKEGDKKPIIMSITDDSMELKINSVIGSMKEDLSIEKSGRDMMIGFNPKFLIDALRVIDDERVDIYLLNSKSPCVIKNLEETYQYLILPVNFTTVS